jgi:hypothetical protein
MGGEGWRVDLRPGGQYLKSSDPDYDPAEIEACFAALHGEDGEAHVCGGLSFEEV